MIYAYILAPIIGYLFGSIPFAWFIVKLTTGKDVRKEGSGSVSTRNTVRTAGWGWAVITASMDVTKGFIGAFLTLFVFFPESAFISAGTYYNGSLLTALCGLGAFAGHCWMPWMKFKGGKGFAVLTGSLIIINPWCIIVWWVTILIWALITRYSGIAGILSTASVAITLTVFYFTDATAWNDWPVLLFGWGCTVLVILRMIPDLIAIRKGEIKPWKGIKVSQWMK